MTTDVYQPVQDIAIEDDPFAAPSAPKPARKSSYDPGQAGEIRFLGNGCFEVESFRDSGASYAVDIREGTCSCPHHLYRIAPKREAGYIVEDCKHYRAVQDEIARRRALAA